MVPQTVVILANVFQSTVMLISMGAYVPQWLRILRTRSSVDLSIPSWCLWSVTPAMALFYAVVQLLLNGRGWALVFSSSMSLAMSVTTLILAVKYRQGGAARTDLGRVGSAANSRAAVR